MSPTVALLSIHLEYSNMIFEGTKQVELRKVRPRCLSEGDIIVVYATSPQKAIVGILEVEKVIEEVPSTLWKLVKGKACVNYSEFVRYYRNSATGFAIFIRKIHKFNVPLDLSSIKEEWKNFHPPQCYKYLNERELDLVEEMSGFDIKTFSDRQFCKQFNVLDKEYFFASS